MFVVSLCSVVCTLCLTILRISLATADSEAVLIVGDLMSLRLVVCLAIQQVAALTAYLQ